MVGSLGEDAEGRVGVLEEQVFGEGAGERERGGRGTGSWGLC